MATHLPLPTLLSQLLIAFTIEFDNEFERQMPHRTTLSSAEGTHRGPWLASLVMWSNFMRFLGEEGIPLRDLQDQARMTNLAGLERWRYIAVAPDPADSRPKPPRRDWLVRATPAGRRAQEVWRPLAATIEQRWRARFGEDQIDALRESLGALVSQFDVELPHYPPVVGYGMTTTVPLITRRRPTGLEGDSVADLDLSVLLSQVLIAFTLDFERESRLSLAISATILRVLDERGVRVRDLPLLAGISKQAIDMALGFLEKGRYLTIEPDPAAGRTKIARLTPLGREAQESYSRLLDAIEQRWRTRFGMEEIDRLQESLRHLLDRREGEQPGLSQGLLPHPGGWRARPPYLTQTTAVLRDHSAALPHHPMVLHRGGYPDGS